MDKEFQIYVLIFCFVIGTVYSDCPIAQVCVHDMQSDDCFPFVVVPGLTVHGCCPGCGFAPSATTTPAPGNETQQQDNTCKPPSTCLEDGSFGPVQCKGDQFMGRCFCTDESGGRIFGQMWRNEASEMTCACSRRRAELEKKLNRTVTLHCTTTGDYEPLQCDDGMCWCTEPKTGQPTVMPVPEEDMTRLPCYKLSEIGTQYLRRCESLVHAVAMISQEQVEHGTNFFGNPVTVCDYDGTYGSYQIQNGVAYCSGPDGKFLGSWQTLIQNVQGMNCNCARDSSIYFPERGRTVTEVCSGNGNYQDQQNAGSVFYCVDSDGYPVTDFMDKWPEGATCNNFI